MNKIGLVTFTRDRNGKIVYPSIPYCTYSVKEANEIKKRRKANKVARKQRKINRMRSGR